MKTAQLPTSTRSFLGSDYSISRVVKGSWQLSAGHTIGAQMSAEQSIEDTLEYIRAGITTLDFGDIYLGVEELIGEMIRKLEKEAGKNVRDLVQLHTKYVPDIHSLATHSFEDVRNVVHRSLKRLGVEYLDLVQFHWWDYNVPGYIEAFQFLNRLKEEGYIRLIGVTNFDVEHLTELVNAGLLPETIQLQYSLLDRRPENGMVEFCRRHDIDLLCYGTVAGGFLSEKYLDMPDPDPPYENRSLVKYRLIIDEFGGWDSFQELLQVLNHVAQKHGVDIGTVASAYILQRQQVAAVIVGARNKSHLSANLQILALQLDNDDLIQIGQCLLNKAGPTGDVYNVERNDPRHSGIMHKNNNALKK